MDVTEELFGSPGAPHFAVLETWSAEGFDPNSDLAGAVTYFQSVCRRCHGTVGAGNGPMAKRLTPRPRDYRRGLFKFTAMRSPSRPRVADLMRTLEHGLPGTAMPSFRRLEGEERERLAEYVRLLAMRGELERWCVADWEQDGVPPRESALQAYRVLWRRWRTADDLFVGLGDEVPAPTPALIAEGDRLFHDEQGPNCARCHGVEGRGDGPAVYEFNEAGERIAALQDDWGYFTTPRDLAKESFRGGRRPLDVYRRLACGIHGTPMPSFGDTTGEAGAAGLSERELWALTHYALSLAEPSSE